MLKIKQPRDIKKVHKILNKNGYESYIVGGCVRDFLLGKKPKDWDVTTNATPEQIINCFKNKYKVIETGIKHGTVTIVMPSMNVEITTYRIDGEYTDHRHPEEVKFVNNLKEDLSRRDFTINAMAYNDKEGLIDYFNGYVDLLNKTINCVGNPDTRFNEDPLRILRAARFYCTLGNDWEIEQETSRSMKKYINCDLLKNVSRERICSEFLKMLPCDKFFNVAWGYTGLFGQIFPQFNSDELKYFKNKRSNLYHCLNILPRIDSKDPSVLLACLFHGIYDCECGNLKCDMSVQKICTLCEESLRNLKMDNKTIKHTLDILSNWDIVHRHIFRTKENILNLFRKVEPKIVYEIIDIKITCCRVSNNSDSVALLQRFKKFCKEVEDSGCAYKVSQLKIDGNDIKKLIPNISGIQIGNLLEVCLQQVIKENINNTKKDLLKFVSTQKFNI